MRLASSSAMGGHHRDVSMLLRCLRDAAPEDIALAAKEQLSAPLDELCARASSAHLGGSREVTFCPFAQYSAKIMYDMANPIALASLSFTPSSLLTTSLQALPAGSPLDGLKGLAEGVRDFFGPKLAATKPELFSKGSHFTSGLRRSFSLTRRSTK